MSIPDNLAKHQDNLQVGPIIANMMAKVNGRSYWASWAHRAATAVLVTPILVDDLFGELLVYHLDLWLPSHVDHRAMASLCNRVWDDDPCLIYGDDDHMVTVVSMWFLL